MNSFAKNETTGRLTYGDGAGGTQLITLEHTRRGVSGRFGEPERRIRVRRLSGCKQSADLAPRCLRSRAGTCVTEGVSLVFEAARSALHL